MYFPYAIVPYSYGYMYEDKRYVTCKYVYICNPSQKCHNLNDVNTYCRSTGADGIAFVIKNVLLMLWTMLIVGWAMKVYSTH